MFTITDSPVVRELIESMAAFDRDSRVPPIAAARMDGLLAAKDVGKLVFFLLEIGDARQPSNDLRLVSQTYLDSCA